MAGVTENGIDIKTFREIESDIQKRLDDGDSGIVITDESNKIANNVAMSIILSLAELWQFGESVYNSGNIYKATGTTLDKLVAYRRLIRIPAAFSTGQVEISASGRVALNTNVRFKDVRGRQVQVTENRSIGISNFTDFTLTLSVAVPTTKYFIVINAVEYGYTTASSGDTNIDVLNELKTVIDNNSNGSVTVTVNPSEENINIVSTSGDNMVIAYQSDLLLGNYKVKINARASELGPLNFPPNTITQFVNNINGITSVTNPEAFTIGRQQETDSELRTRFLQTPAATREATVDSIIRAVDAVEGVTNVSLINNPTSSPDAEGVPAKAFEVIVAGGEDVDIAEAIFRVAAAGIESHGDTTLFVTDSKGNPHPIGFTRPTNLYVFFRVRYEPYPEEALPADVVNLITNAIVDFGAGLLPNQDVIPSRFTVPIYNNVTGIGEVVIECGSSLDSQDTSPPSGYSSDRVEISNRQVAIIEPSRILVEQVTLP